MSRYIYSGQEVPHLFAADRSAYASNSNRSLRAESGVLWSYSQPIAAYVGDLVLISSDSFSVTTSKHQSWARYALRHLKTLSVPKLKQLIQNRSERDVAEYIADRVAEIADIRESMVKMRAAHKKDQAQRDIAWLESVCAFAWNTKLGKKTPWQSALKSKAKTDKADAIRRYTASRNRLESGMDVAQDCIRIARVQMEYDATNGRNGGLQSWWRLETAVRDVIRIDEMSAHNGLGIGGSATFAHAAKIMGKTWAKECEALALALVAYAESFTVEIAELRAEHDRLESLSDQERVATWLAGGNAAPRGMTICRVIGDQVETSRGARVPLSDALQIAALAKACRESGKAMDLRNRAVGSYRGNSIDAQGNVTIGCHNLTWEAIADCVARYEMESV